MADEARQHSQGHQKWIIDTLNEKGGSASYEVLVEVGEEHHCDTVGAMLKILKNRGTLKTTTMADEARQHSQGHQKWIIDTLNEKGGSASYEVLVEVGEEHHCDTVGAMLKILKNRGVIAFDQIFLMYPMHKDEIITIQIPDYDPFQN
eukprot:TRINITY_DN10202_c0_g1_i1.p1 TRINITY_DN10202_c0_g1~~TRINITY_DN10202_c0_g1_i1.p1  ORF type:complete len:161 (-),score=42.23 TRINITY_DN10202_c0_g1_i1:84-527(-)